MEGTPAYSKEGHRGGGALFAVHLHTEFDTTGVFEVPPVPRVGRHPEPRPFHRSTPGYDMKTIRGQLDSMRGELEGRYSLQAALYAQNEKLWEYSADLLGVSRQYGLQTERQLALLHDHFQLVQDERENICLQLVDAKSVYSNIIDQRAESGELVDALGLLTERRTAMIADLDRVREENVELESIFQRQGGEVILVHEELQEVTETKYADEQLERADCHFYVTSQSSLRGAFGRFRQAIRRSHAAKSVISILLRQYCTFLKVKTFSALTRLLWARRLRVSLSGKRAQSATVDTFTRWKTYAAMESYFRRRALERTQKLFVTVFSRWRDLSVERRWALCADDMTRQHVQRRLVRNVFNAWRSVTVFLPWTGDWLRVPTHLAIRHYKRQILLRWLAAARQCALENSFMIAGVHNLIVRAAINSWKRSLLAVPAAVRNGLLRGFRALWHDCTDNLALMISNSRARLHYQDICKRVAVWRLYHASRFHVRKRAMEKKVLDTANMRKVQRIESITRSILYLWGARTLSLRRALISVTIAIEHRKRILLSNGILRLRRLAGLVAGNRLLCLSSMPPPGITARRALLLWRRRVVLGSNFSLQTMLENCDRRGFRGTVRIKELDELAVAHHSDFVKATVIPALLGSWRRKARLFSSQRKAYSIVRTNAFSRLLRKALLGWRGTWARRLCWRMRAAAIDQSELFAQINVLHKEWDSLSAEQEELQGYKTEVNAAVMRMKQAIAAKELDIEHGRVNAEGLDSEAQALQLLCIDLSAALQRTAEDRQRAAYMEEIITKETRLEEERVRETTAAAGALLRRLSAEAQDMRCRVEEARARVEETEDRMREAEFEQEEGLADALATARRLHELAERQTEDLEGSQDLQRVLESTIEGIRKRLCGLGEEGDSAVIEEDVALRKKTAQVRVLRQNATQTEARVSAMRRFKLQREEELQVRQRQLAIEGVQRELKELTAAGEAMMGDFLVHRAGAGFLPGNMSDQNDFESPGLSSIADNTALSRSMLSPQHCTLSDSLLNLGQNVSLLKQGSTKIVTKCINGSSKLRRSSKNNGKTRPTGHRAKGFLR